MLSYNQYLFIKDVFMYNDEDLTKKEISKNLVSSALYYIYGDTAKGDQKKNTAIQKKTFLNQSAYNFFDRQIINLNSIKTNGLQPCYSRPSTEGITPIESMTIQLCQYKTPSNFNSIDWSLNSHKIHFLCKALSFQNNNPIPIQQIKNKLFAAIISKFVIKDNNYSSFVNSAASQIQFTHSSNHSLIQNLIQMTNSILSMNSIPDSVVRPKNEFDNSMQTFQMTPLPLLPNPIQFTNQEFDDYLNKIFVYSPTSYLRRNLRQERSIRLMIEVCRASLSGQKNIAKQFKDYLDKAEKPYWKGIWFCDPSDIDNWGWTTGKETNIHSDENLYDYLSVLYEVMDWIYTEGEIPDEIKVPRSFLGIDDFVTKLSPTVGEIEVDKEGPKAIIFEDGPEIDLPEKMIQTFETLQSMPQQEYLETRAESIQHVAEQIKNNNLKETDPSKLQEELDKVKEEIEKDKEYYDKEILIATSKIEKKNKDLLEKEKKLKEELGKHPDQYIQNLGLLSFSKIGLYRRTRFALGRYVRFRKSLDSDKSLSRNDLGGIFDSFKKTIAKVRKSISRGFSSVAEEAKRGIRKVAPSEVFRLVDRIDSELGRFEKRVRKESFRFSKRAMKVTPFIKLMAPFLVFIPVVGVTLAILTAAGVATVEIHYTYKIKQQLKKQMKRVLQSLLNELAILEEKLQRMEKLTKDLEKIRLELSEINKNLTKQRKSILEDLVLPEDGSRKYYIASGLGVAAMIPFVFDQKLNLWKSIYLVACGGAAFYVLSKGPEKPESVIDFEQCVLTKTESICKQNYLDKRLQVYTPQFEKAIELSNRYQSLLSEGQKISEEVQNKT